MCAIVNKTDYYVTIILQQLVASNFAKDRENVKGELRFNVIFPFLRYCLLSSRYVMFEKKIF